MIQGSRRFNSVAIRLDHWN